MKKLENDRNDPEQKQMWDSVAVTKQSALLREVTSKYNGDFVVWIVLIPLQQKINLDHINTDVKITFFVVLECLLKKYKIKVYSVPETY